MKREWYAPTEISRDGMDVVYREADIRIQIKRRFSEKDLIEQYTFTNEGKEEAFLHDIGIYTPFNDNYPMPNSASTNVHMHISGRARMQLTSMLSEWGLSDRTWEWHSRKVP